MEYFDSDLFILHERVEIFTFIHLATFRYMDLKWKFTLYPIKFYLPTYVDENNANKDNSRIPTATAEFQYGEYGP